MTQRITGQRFRQRKLSTKQNIPVLREHEIEKLDDDEASRHIPRVETGVEKGEEIVSLPTRRFGHSLQGLCCYGGDKPQLRVISSSHHVAYTYLHHIKMCKY